MPRQSRPPDSINSRAGPSTGSPASRPRASLLTIPLELREEMYCHLAHHSPKTLLDLLVVSRRFAREVKPFLYKKPLSFDGQSELFDWLNQVDHGFLRYVVDVRFKLVDIDPETIVGALGKRLREAEASRHPGGADVEDNPYYEACFQDLKRLQRAFSMLPSIKKFTIVSCTPSDPLPPSQMIDGLSKLLGHCFPDLRTLISEEILFRVNFIANKPNLKRLRFPANTESSEDDIVAAFRNLSELRLEICRLQPLNTVNYDLGCMAELLPYVPALRSLTLFEQLDNTPPGLLEEVFVDSIEAMKRHLRSLRKLAIIADPPPKPQEAGAMKRNLLRFMEASHLWHVEVLGTYASIYRHLPGTVETFVLRLDKQSSPQVSFAKAICDLMDHVKFRAVTANKDPHIPRLSRLREIQVWVAAEPAELNAEDDEDDEDAEDLVESFKQRLRKIGIFFTLYVHPASGDRLTGSEDIL